MSHRLLTVLLYLFAGLIGLVALLYPFIRASLPPAGEGTSFLRLDETPLLATLLVTLCLAVLLVELQGQAAGAKTVAALGVMVAVTSTLRFIEVGIPGPAGFSPIFAPILLGGYVFGPRFGFLLGAMTMLVSAFVTAGVGPWLPYQMFTAGWLGFTAGLLPHPRRPAAELGLLLAFAFLWGFLYGGIMNLSTWPYLTGDPSMTYAPGAGVGEAARHYAAYYLATSLLWDSAAAIGNVVLVAVLGLPTIKALSRFRGRFQFQVVRA
jgi:energy-coupling factor transport system substrate-specific component